MEQLLLNNIAASVTAGVAPLMIPEPLTMNEWGKEHFWLSEESSSISGPWEALPYQVAWLNWFGNDDIEIVDCQKAARLGYTKCVMIAVGYFTEHKKRNIVIYEPTDTDAVDFVKDEIDTMLRDVPIFGEQLKCKPGTKSPYNTLDKKVFKHTILDIKGGKTARNYRRITKDVVIYEEIDGFDQDIDKEGSPLTLGDTRVETSSFPKSIRGTTPKLKGLSHIEGSLEHADAVFRRYLPCPHCGNMDYLKWSNLVFDSANLTKAEMSCEQCGKFYTYSDFPAMDAAGQWRTEHGMYYDESQDLFFDADGQAVPAPRHLGSVIWSGYSYFLSWTKLASEFLAANKAKKEGVLSKIKTFINTKLGETYEETGEKIEETYFDDRLEEWEPGAIPNEVLCITASVDVQGGKNARVEIETVGWGEGDESWSLDYKKFPGDADYQEVWDHLDAYRKIYFTRLDGVPLRIKCLTVDSGFKTNAVYNYTTPRQASRVYATKGHNTAGKPIVGTPSKQGDRKETILYMIGTDTAKETLFSNLQLDEKGPGYCHFPMDRESEYFEQLTAEEKKVVFERGVKKVKFVKKKAGIRNEAIDLRVGNMVALKLLRPNFKILKARYEKLALKIEERRAEAGQTQSQGNAPTVKKTARRKRKRGFIHGWK